jgi:hypothetical protein
MPSPDEIARAAHARASLAAQRRERARAQLAAMGIEATEEQIEAAGTRILKAEQRDRMAVARRNRWTGHVDAKRAADVNFATDQAIVAADRVKALYPTVSVDADVMRVCLMAVADELDAPDGFNRNRLLRRLDLYVKGVMEECSRLLNATLPDLAVNVDGDE